MGESNCRVLVVDDNRDGADSMSRMLSILGHEVRTAYDGYQALETAGTFQPEVVLLDIGMPHMNGYEVARRMRRESWGKGIILIALTGWGREEDRRASEEAGFNYHLVKPADAMMISQLLSELKSSSR